MSRKALLLLTRVFSVSLSLSAGVEAQVQKPPILTRAGAWWGDVNNPSLNQVWADVQGVVPDGKVTGDLSLAVTCQLPAPSTMKLLSMVAQVDSKNVVELSKVLPGESKAMTIPTRKFADGWHEIRIRCKAQETKGLEAGKVTAVTNGYPLCFANVDTTCTKNPGQNSGKNYVDSHAWYSTDVATGADIGYVYAQLNNVRSLIDRPLSGTVSINGRIRRSGDTSVAHWAIKMDGNFVIEYHGSTETRTFSLDTKKFPNGTHLLSFHGHGLGTSGQQLAAEVKVPIVIQN